MAGPEEAAKASAGAKKGLCTGHEIASRIREGTRFGTGGLEGSAIKTDEQPQEGWSVRGGENCSDEVNRQRGKQ
jgi:hypothetical protein